MQRALTPPADKLAGRSRSDGCIKTMMIGSAIIILVGITFIVSQTIINAATARPQHDLEPYPGSTEGLDTVVTVGSLELSVVRTYIGTMDPHHGPTTMGCSVKVSLYNKGNESITDYQSVMGTVFDEDDGVIYSFWVSMHLDGVAVARVSIPAATTLEVYCYDVGSYELNDSPFNYSAAYIRVQFLFAENQTAIVTTPLTEVWHAIE